MSVSVTTRPKRPGEVSGVDYHFIDASEFESEASIAGSCSSGPRCSAITTARRERRSRRRSRPASDVLFDIDWQGTQQLAESAREDLVSIFILPPSMRELERRLKGRAQDSAEEVARRMAKAADEMSHWAEYDYIIVNRDLERSLEQVQAILQAERLRRERQIGLHEFVKGLARRPVARRSASARAANSSMDSSSARLVSAMPAAASSPAGSPPSARRLWRSILRRWPKAAAVDPFQQGRLGRRPAASGERHQLHDARGHLGRRGEGARRNIEQPRDLAAPLGRHRRAGRNPCCAAWRQPVRHLALEHQHQALEAFGCRQPAQQQGGVRHCRADWRRCAAAHRPAGRHRCARHRLAITSSRPGNASRDLAQRRQAALVALDGDEALRRHGPEAPGSIRPGQDRSRSSCRAPSSPAARAMRPVRLRSRRKCCPSEWRASRP